MSLPPISVHLPEGSVQQEAGTCDHRLHHQRPARERRNRPPGLAPQWTGFPAGTGLRCLQSLRHSAVVMLP